MSTRLKKNLPLLKWLSVAKPRTARSMLKAADKDVVNTLSECCVNVLRGNVPLSDGQKRKLCKYKRHMRRLAAKSTSHTTKKALLQNGGFLGSLLTPILSMLGQALFH